MQYQLCYTQLICNATVNHNLQDNNHLAAVLLASGKTPTYKNDDKLSNQFQTPDAN